MGGSLPLVLALFHSITAHSICNEGSLSCPCPDCWSLLSSPDTIDWISIETQLCSPLPELSLRSKVAGWVSEECGASLHCGVSLPLLPSQVLIGNLSCDSSGRGLVSLVVLLSPLRPFSAANALPAEFLGAALHAREHLLAILLNAHLVSVRLLRRLPSSATPTSTTPPTTSSVPSTSSSSPSPSSSSFVAAVAFFIGSLLLLVVYGVWRGVEWRKMVDGVRSGRVYRKVPSVFRPSDEVSSTLHSASFQSTVELIRY